MNSKPVAILALIAAIGIIFGYVMPTWNGVIKDAKTSIANSDMALQAARDYADAKDRLTSESKAIDKKDKDRLSTLLPDSVDNVQLILDLDALAARSGLSLSNIDVAESSSNSNTTNTGNAKPGGMTTAGSPTNALQTSAQNIVGSIDLTMSAVGTYSALHDFLDKVEKSGRLLDIKDLTVKGSDTGAYGYQIILRLYWLR